MARLNFPAASLSEVQLWARHEDNYNQVIQIGTKICKVDEGYTNEAGFTERFVKDTDKIQIRLLSNNHLIWGDALNWYACK
jgi:hypothetical protein